MTPKIRQLFKKSMHSVIQLAPNPTFSRWLKILRKNRILLKLKLFY